MKKQQNEHLIPVPILDLVQSIYTSRNPNIKETLIFRLEEINKFCSEVLTEINKKR